MTDLGLNVVSRALLLDFEEMKEKHSGGFVLVDSLRFAQVVARAASHRAVACNFAQVVARAASHRATTLNLAQVVARAAAHRAIAFNLAQVVTRAASHRAIACYLTQVVARAAAHRATTLNLAQIVARAAAQVLSVKACCTIHYYCQCQCHDGLDMNGCHSFLCDCHHS